MLKIQSVATGLLLFCYSLTSHAIDFQWGEVDISGSTFLSAGVGVRVEDRDENLIYKLNIKGQQDLCQSDDCLSLGGDTAANQRLVDARGSFSSHLYDDGNLNYDKGDLYTALAKVNSDWSASWGNWYGSIKIVGFFDAVNSDFEEKHPNTLFQAAVTERNQDKEDLIGQQLELRAWQIGTNFEIFDRNAYFSIGRQRLTWRESNLTLLNTLGEINPVDTIYARQPGLPIKDTYNPVELITLGADLTQDISVEAFYQFKWRGVQAEPSGSLFSSLDSIGGGNYSMLSLGQYAEDPDAQYVSQGIIGLFSNSHRTLYVPSEEDSAPSDQGQYGLSLRTYLPEFLDGTEVGFYFANYHSRLPYISMTASQESCARNSTNLIEAASDCNGFNAGRHQETAERCDPRGCDMNAYLAREIMPVDTAAVLLEYPEDLQMYGFSFNSTLGGWSVSGEYSYRPELPVQVLISDVLFAGIQPGLPANSFSALALNALDPLALLAVITNPAAGQRALTLASDLANEGYLSPELASLSIPSSRQAAPDFINNQYRGTTVAPGGYVRGYEQVKAHQFSINTLNVFAQNPFGSTSVTVALEVSGIYLQDMPSTEEGLYIQGRQTFTHPSVGADGTGRAEGEGAAFTFNPTQQTGGFADDFSWGLRALTQLEYPNVWGTSINIKPTLIGFWDVQGTSPFPIVNYVEGNLWLIPGMFANYGDSWSGSVFYQHFAGPNNQLRDRDSIAIEVTYSF